VGPPPAIVSPVNNPTLDLPVTLTWQHVPNPQPSGYEVEIATNSSFTSIEESIPQLNGPMREVLSLTPGTKFWRVRSHQGMSSPTTPALTAWSATGSFTINSSPPKPVSIAPLRIPLYSGDDTWVAVQLTAAVPSGGATISLSSSDPVAAPVPATIPIQGGHAWTQFQMRAGQVTTPTPVTLTATLNGGSVNGSFTVQPPSLKSVDMVSSMTGGVTAGANIMLNGQAPAGGATVNLSSNSPAASTPPTATVPAGSYSVPITFPTSPVTTNTIVTITASWNGTTVQSQVTLTPQLPPETLTLTPTSVVGTGGSSFGRVTVATPPSSDLLLPLTTSHPSIAQINTAVVIPAGSTQGGFNISTSPVSVPSDVTISVSGGGVTRSAILTVTPDSPPTPGTPTLLSPARDATVAQPVTFDWNDVANATSYEIQVDNTSTIAAPFVASRIVTASTASIGGLPAQRLWWRVRARNSAGVFGSFSSTRRFTAQSAPATAALGSVTLNPTSVIGGSSSQGTVALTAAAPSGGAVVSLSSSSASGAVPSNVTVPAGATSAGFTVTTSAVTTSTGATISASWNGTTRSATLTINPPSSSPPPAPALITPSNDARFAPGQTITFDWSDVSGAASYRLEIDDRDSFSAPLVLSQTTTSSQFATSSLPILTMWWRVRAVSSTGTLGSWSAVRRVEVKD
jgi:hypothetical protein